MRGPQRLRIWSAGCATGEETYSLAISSRALPETAGWDISILGTDLSTAFLARAQHAIYREWSLREVDESTRSRYFREIAAGRFELVAETRERVTFDPLNLAGIMERSASARPRSHRLPQRADVPDAGTATGDRATADRMPGRRWLAGDGTGRSDGGMVPSARAAQRSERGLIPKPRPTTPAPPRHPERPGGANTGNRRQRRPMARRPSPASPANRTARLRLDTSSAGPRDAAAVLERSCRRAPRRWRHRSSRRSDRFELVIFRAGSERYAIDAVEIEEAIVLPDVTPLPGVPSFYRGLIAHQGIVYPLIDVRPLAGADAEDELAPTHAILFSTAEHTVAIAAESVESFVRVDVAAIADLGIGSTFTACSVTRGW